MALKILSVYKYFSMTLSFLSGVFGYPSQCRFPVTCSDYAKNQFETEKFFVACRRIASRLLQCGPWGRIR